MDARNTRSMMSLAAIFAFSFQSLGSAQFVSSRESVAHSPNFIVFASSPQWAAQVARVAEKNRRELAHYWLGKELPAWSQRCPIHVHSAPNLGAGGETRFSLLPGGAGNWMMSVQGTPDRVLDSVLPHEITHTIFATHFARLGKYVPRWADEGACTTVEHESEKSKHAQYLQQFLRTGRGLSFNNMFSLKEYPSDILPLYAQGHSAVQFLIDQGGPKKFVKFIEAGMATEAWEKSLRDHYAYKTLGQFQTLWNKWLIDGSPDNLVNYAPGLKTATTSLASNTTRNAGIEDKVQFALESNEAAPISLVSSRSSDQTLPHAPLALSNLETPSSGREQVVGKESWYQRRLREVTSDIAADSKSEPRPVADVSQPSSVAVNSGPSTAPLTEFGALSASEIAPATPRSQSMGRPQKIHGPQVQVLDWGASPPVSGIQTSTIQMVPIRR